MLKKISLVMAILLLGAFSIVWIKIIAPMQASADRFGPETAARDYALQDNSRIQIPAAPIEQKQPAPSAEMNLYWGELHVHTSESFDATLFGNTLGIEDAYRLASG